jgi:hypothetical protein
MNEEIRNPKFGTRNSKFEIRNQMLTRRGFIAAAGTGALGLTASPLAAGEDPAQALLAQQVAGLTYLTPLERFQGFGREKPRVDQLPAAKLREVGLDRDTWQLEVIPDPDSDCQLEQPLSRAQGTALDWPALMKLAETHAVRFLKLLTCTNMDEPLGMGLWEGVPLRVLIWKTRPRANIRRVFYYGYHNDEAKQRFQSSLSLGRVLEDPPGELPITLCYKLNGQLLSVKQGGPVRLIVPEAYGNKCVKWLQRVVLTNSYQANDTYALWNNDVESPMKTWARFLRPPAKARAGTSLPLVGIAQVGLSGLSKVQFSIWPEQNSLPEDDPYLTKLPWQDGQILPPPKELEIPNSKFEIRNLVPLQVDPVTGQFRSWPLRYTLAYWTGLVHDLRPGRYHLRCRSLDANGVAQPLPRPLPKSGNNAIQKVTLMVEG